MAKQSAEGPARRAGRPFGESRARLRPALPTCKPFGPTVSRITANEEFQANRLFYFSRPNPLERCAGGVTGNGVTAGLTRSYRASDGQSRWELRSASLRSCANEKPDPQWRQVLLPHCRTRLVRSELMVFPARRCSRAMTCCMGAIRGGDTPVGVLKRTWRRDQALECRADSSRLEFGAAVEVHGRAKVRLARWGQYR